MIFSKEYDRALFLVLYADKNNRYDIANLVRIIPKELVVRIQNELMKDNISDKVEFIKAFRDDNEELLKFIIKIDNYSLRIQLFRWANNYEDVYDLDLGKVNFDNFDDSDLVYIGSYYCGNTSSFLGFGLAINNSLGMGYEIYVNRDDKYCIQVTGDKFLFNNQYDKVVNIDINSLILSNKDLINKQNINRLIRGKKR